MVSNLFSWLVTNCPLSIRTAPNIPRLLRVGAWKTTGSASSGGIHMVHRDPCCWKWHSSSNHKSRSSLAARRRSFFIFPLCFRIRFSNEGTRFAPAKSQLPEQPLALADTQVDAEFLGNVMAKQFSIPKVLGIAQLTRRATQIFSKSLNNAFVQGSRTTWTLRILQASKTAILKTTDPVLHGAGTLAKEFCHFVTAKARAYQQDSMKAMVITGLIRSEDLLLYCDLHDICIFDFEFAHGALLPARSIAERNIMRNYLCRYVYIKKLMIYQVNKCDENLLREKFHESKLSLKSRIDTSFKEDKKHGIAYFKKDRISIQFFESIQYLLGFIGAMPAFTQQALIEQLISVLSKNNILFNEYKIREQERKIVLCILCLLNNTHFEHGGYEPGYCKISCERTEIMNIPDFVDKEGNEIESVKSFGNLSLQGYVLLKKEDRDFRVCYTVFETDLSVEEWCDKDLFMIKIQGTGNNKIEFKKVNLDTDLVISDDFKLSRIPI